MGKWSRIPISPLFPVPSVSAVLLWIWLPVWNPTSVISPASLCKLALSTRLKLPKIFIQSSSISFLSAWLGTSESTKHGFPFDEGRQVTCAVGRARPGSGALWINVLTVQFLLGEWLEVFCFYYLNYFVTSCHQNFVNFHQHFVNFF